jgi:Zn2+/Cd2+-exporting ATPase
VSEIPAMGMTGLVAGRKMLAGNSKLMIKNNVEVSPETESIRSTCIHIAVDNRYAGYFVLPMK